MTVALFDAQQVDQRQQLTDLGISRDGDPDVGPGAVDRDIEVHGKTNLPEHAVQPLRRKSRTRGERTPVTDVTYAL